LSGESFGVSKTISSQPSPDVQVAGPETSPIVTVPAPSWFLAEGTLETFWEALGLEILGMVLPYLGVDQLTTNSVR
jgi:hypothetical protein